jgi:hypothetical protein
MKDIPITILTLKLFSYLLQQLINQISHCTKALTLPSAYQSTEISVHPLSNDANI